MRKTFTNHCARHQKIVNIRSNLGTPVIPDFFRTLDTSSITCQLVNFAPRSNTELSNIANNIIMKSCILDPLPATPLKQHFDLRLPIILLNLCLTSTYFQYNAKHYKQLYGTAMGSPLSVVAAEIVMQNIEEQVLATYTRTVPLWLRYVQTTHSPPYTKTESTIFTNTLTDRTRTYSSPRRSKKMVRYLF